MLEGRHGGLVGTKALGEEDGPCLLYGYDYGFDMDASVSSVSSSTSVFPGGTLLIVSSQKHPILPGQSSPNTGLILIILSYASPAKQPGCRSPPSSVKVNPPFCQSHPPPSVNVTPPLMLNVKFD